MPTKSLARDVHHPQRLCAGRLHRAGGAGLDPVPHRAAADRDARLLASASTCRPTQQGGPEDVYTLANYRYFLLGYPGNPDGYNYVDLAVFGRTLVAAIFVTILDLILCYPIAFYLAQVAKGTAGPRSRRGPDRALLGQRDPARLRVRVIFGASGIINSILIGLGITDQPDRFRARRTSRSMPGWPMPICC